ncbi:MAG TPA: NPCBM/NEW2 domain-containing protein, partial [Tepidisphaeraceae bacterium]
GNAYDHADWANARLVGTGGQPVTPPAAPTSLNATLNTSKVDLTWTDGSTDETGFRVERKLGAGGTWAAVQTVGAGVTSWSDTSPLAPSSTYFYRVFAFNGGGDSTTASNEANITTPAGSQVWLSDLTWVSATNGWGPVEKDTSNGEAAAGDGVPMAIRGNTYTKGLGVHANSTIVFNLGGQYSTFMSDIGIDNETGGKGRASFQVFVDGVLAYDSGVVRGTDAVKQVLVNVKGAQQLRLVVGDAGDGNSYDHADWAGAQLIP